MKSKKVNVLFLLGLVCIFSSAGLIIFSRMQGNFSLISTYVPILMPVGFVLIMLGTVVPLILESLKASKLKKNGVFTIGRLISAKQTGLTVNNQPQQALTVEIELPGGTKEVSEILAIISLNDLAYLQQNAVLPVRYDPNNPKKMTLDLNQPPEVMQQAVNKMMIKKGVMSKEALEINKRGEKAQAVILELHPTGNIHEGIAEISFQLKVTKANGEQFETTQVKKIPQQNLGQLTVGSIIQVAFLPENQDQMIFITKWLGY